VVRKEEKKGEGQKEKRKEEEGRQAPSIDIFGYATVLGIVRFTRSIGSLNEQNVSIQCCRKQKLTVI